MTILKIVIVRVQDLGVGVRVRILMERREASV